MQVEARDWYETIRMSDDVTLIHEPWIKPFYRCNMWHVRGRDRDLLLDSGLGHFSLSQHVSLVTERALTCVSSHCHFDHIGSTHEFPDRCVHHAEAHILSDPRSEWTLASPYAADAMFDATVRRRRLLLHSRTAKLSYLVSRVWPMGYERMMARRIPSA